MGNDGLHTFCPAATRSLAMTQRFAPARHHRRSIRLRGYDYTRPGVYFITICTHDRRRLFGDIANGRMRLNDAGVAADTVWRAIPTHFPHVRLDAFVVMPNHVHGVVVITTPGIPGGRVGATHASPLQCHAPSDPTHAPFEPTDASPRPTDASPARPTSSAPVWRRAPPHSHGDPIPPRATARATGPTPCSVGAIVGAYKSAVSRRINQLRDTPGAPIWQRDYYERIVRDDDALRRIRAYIEANPRRWDAPRGRCRVG